ncbi:phytanoyl-CoA dioxygenase domain-containing protein 1 [Parasteatoda tepidariorum]|uniref:phytanoyl-CoA dioxygenase domain-containing protein 1 n=1 Tax=Parasteatoda tepidariorum TaxID=114398 RepID=UPI00077FCDEB
MPSSVNYQKVVEEYRKNGCCKIENFLDQSELDDMQKGLSDALKHMTDDLHVYSSYNNPKSKEDLEYYINSGDKVAYFFENDAFDEDGNLTVKDKQKALNKIAYALHWWNPNFKRISFNQKIKDLLRALEYKDPAICQSMLIFKHPEIGEIFRPHQDSTFLYTEPESCIGIWLPMEDATLENGCLWYLPGSHKSGIHVRYVRKPGNDPFLVMEGKIPDDLYNEGYVPIPAKKGDCVLIHGQVLHKSGRNKTDKPRVVYTFHAIENGAEWSEKNWVQPTTKLPFPSIYAN